MTSTSLRDKAAASIFASIDPNGGLQQNPITGADFTLQDPIADQIDAAEQALEAQLEFSCTAPNDVQPLPTNERDWWSRSATPLGYITVLYLQSKSRFGYKLPGHPNFVTYASAVLADPTLRLDRRICDEVVDLPCRFPQRHRLKLNRNGTFLGEDTLSL